MRTWLSHHAVSLAQTVRRLAASPSATLLNALVIGAALALPLGGHVILNNLRQFARSLSAEAQISVFLAQQASKEDIAAIRDRLDKAPGISSVEFVSRDKALDRLRREPGMAEVIATLRKNPLPDAFVATLAASDPELALRLKKEFGALPEVAYVQSDSAWVQRVDSLLRFGRMAVTLTAALLSFALIAVAFNTIRLQILTQRDEIEVAKLIGATNAYIRRPFFYLGMLQGALGGMVGCGIVECALILLNRDLTGLATFYGAAVRLRLLDLGDALAVLALASALGWLGAYVSVSKHLRKIEPR